MTAKRIVLLLLANQDVADILAYYKGEGGVTLSTRWAQAVEVALRHIGSYPASGSPRYVSILGLPDLRFERVRKFPYLVFYVEFAAHVEVWRVLHAQRGIPDWLQQGD